MTDIFHPAGKDSDPEAEAAMHQGKRGHELYDPWFPTAEHAATWEPPAGFDSERA